MSIATKKTRKRFVVPEEIFESWFNSMPILVTKGTDFLGVTSSVRQSFKKWAKLKMKSNVECILEGESLLLRHERSKLDRFWEKVDRSGDCWTWIPTARSGFGYGKFAINRTMINAHRASWILNFGEIPDGRFVLHKCDNPPCVRPDHLFLGTHTDNMRDMLSKGRGRWKT